MRDAVIVDAVRTPVGKRGGGLSTVHPVDLSALVLSTLASRTGLDPGLVDDVIWGCVDQVDEQGGGIGRYSVLAAGWPESVPGVTVDRQCGSSQQAVHQAAAGVISGQYDIAVAGGVESMSRVPMGGFFADGMYGEPFGPMVCDRYPGVQFNQGVAAEGIAVELKLTRTELDEHALASHDKAARATDEGAFESQLVPVEVADTTVGADEGIRRGGSLETLAKLRTPFVEDGVVSAGNSSQISDGAAALLVTTSELCRRYGWRPLARVHAATVVGVDPVSMLTGPIPATQKVLARAGLKLEEVGAFEINEAFASVSLGWQRVTGADPAKLNPLGGAIALGHPLGGSGARIMTTLVHHMHSEGRQWGLQSMCEAGGMANATLLERLR